jgi:F-type H+-transporting ATPase subunit b
LHELGIDLRTIIIQALGFLIILFILWRFAFGRIGGLLEKRRQDVLEQTRRLEETEKELGKLKGELGARLSGIEAEARSKLQAALDEASKERDRMIEEARREADGQLERARREIEREKESAIFELRGYVADLAVAAASRIIEADLDDDRHRKLIDDFINQLPSRSAGGGAPAQR